MTITLRNTPLAPLPAAWRRPSRANETRDYYVRAAIPSGALRAAHGLQVRRALLEAPEYAMLYANRRRTILAVLDQLISSADRKTMTSRPGWDLLTAAAGVGRSAMASALRFLRSLKLVGVVASGRSARYATRGEDGKRINEAAVYVLCLPVKELRTPTRLGSLKENLKKLTPARARKTGESWPIHRSPGSRPQRLSAARRLQAEVFVLRKASARHIRHVCRDFWAAGWTPADILHAIDHRPDGTPWPHSGADGIRNVAPWLAYRLKAWRTPAGLLPSRDAQLEAERPKPAPFVPSKRSVPPAGWRSAIA